MSKHTPGPWTTTNRGDEVWAGDTFICRPAATQDRIGGMQLGECRANARLIAAAPDLLEALIHQCPCECRRAIWTDDFGNEREVEDVCRRCAALAAAGQTAPDSAPAFTPPGP